MTSENEIFGVSFKQLKTFGDERGFFRELVRGSDPIFSIDQSGAAPAGDKDCFGQWSHSFMVKNTVKAWHYHHEQFDWWYIGVGQIEAVMYDNRPESPTFKEKMVFKMGDSKTFGPETKEVVVRIPPGVLHGLKVLSDSAHLFYITTHTYNPSEEGRFAYNSVFVGHDWGTDPIVVDNDKRDFVPTSVRKLVR